MTAFFNQRIVHWKGNTREIRITCKNTDGSSINLSGASARWMMAKTSTSIGSNVFISKTSPGDISFEHVGDFWDVVIAVVPSDTDGVDPGTWYHECRVTTAGNVVFTAALGEFLLMASVVEVNP